MDILVAVLGGSAVAALINQVGQYLRDRKTHEETTEKKDDEDIQSLKEAMRLLLMDRIRCLCEIYLRAGEIGFHDLKILHQMHDIYHKLGGNGDLNSLLEQVEELPLKV